MVTTPTFWGSQVIFSTDPFSHATDVAGGIDNTFTIVWHDEFGEIHGRHLNSTGSFTGGDFLTPMSAQITQTLRLPEIVISPDGLARVYFHLLASPTEEDIYVAFPNADFSPSLTRFPVVDFAVDEFLQDAAAAEFNNAAGQAMVWREPIPGPGSRSSLHFAHIASNGLVIGNDVVIPIGATESVQSARLAGLGNGNTVIAYHVFDSATSQSIVRYRVFDDYIDLTASDQNAAPTPGDDAFPAVAALKRASDGFVIVSQSGAGLSYFYHAFGQEFIATVPGTTGGTTSGFAKAISPQIVPLEDQGFIIAWTDTSETEGDGSPALRVALQRFGSNGAAIGENLFINGPGDQSLDSIALLDDGRVVVTFSSETGDSTGLTTLNYQIVDPREPLIFGSFLADNITSREDGAFIQAFEGDDMLIGRGGNDTLEGGAGTDTLIGGAGNDRFINPAGDTIVEAANEGTDTVESNATFSLESFVNVERLFLTGAAAIDGTGNALANQMLGNDKINTINGRDGNDTINSGGGSDTINGGSGLDRLTGGLQRDKIVPGADNVRDTIVYSLIGESTGQTRDVIMGLDLNNEDKIDLPGTVSSIAAARSGALSIGTFNQNLASVFNAAALPVNAAALFTPTSGDLVNPNMVYLIVDANGVAGYQANADWVFQLENHTGALDTSDFI